MNEEQEEFIKNLIANIKIERRNLWYLKKQKEHILKLLIKKNEEIRNQETRLLNISELPTKTENLINNKV